MMLHCVALLGFENTEGATKYGGTGFFLQLRHDEAFTEPTFLRYLVTARHVVTGRPSIPGSGIKHQCAPFAEYTNLRDERFTVDLSDALWIFPEDETVDLAMCYLGGGSPLGLSISEQTLLRASDFSKMGIGIGDETNSLTLFGFRGEALVKTPLVRIGNIAMLPNEPMETEYGDSDLYLVEQRSLSGFSGAPVFVRETVHLAERSHPRDGDLFRPEVFGYVYLLGIVHGHKDLVDGDEQVNSGVAQVVPAQKIHDLIASDAFIADRRVRIEQRREEIRAWRAAIAPSDRVPGRGV